MQKAKWVGRMLGLGLVALATSMSGAVEAQEPGERWKLKLTAASVTATGDSDIDNNIGLGVALEHRFSRRLGIELGFFTSEVEREAEVFIASEPPGPVSLISVVSQLDIEPVLARLVVHLTPDRRTDWYVGPTVGWIRSSEVEVRAFGIDINPIPVARIDTEDTFAWGAFAGVDVPLGDRGLFLTGEATYLAAEIDFEDSFDAAFDLDPLVLQLGIGYRF